METGGILLNSSPTGFSKEPRPVYAAELDVLGFDRYWNYDRQTEVPYMWAEANSYWYRGRLVAKLKGGNLYTAPEIIIPADESGIPIAPEPNGSALRPIDIAAMVEANREMLEIIEQTTVKKILAVYEKYKHRLDLFHVAFSGGKDSAVLLDLVKKALPKGSFVVIFGDTGMEFPDTYDVVEQTRRECEQDEIPFYVAKSHLEPKQSWELFGPPSRVLRWCCSVHKSTPQTLKLREITGKNDYTGLDFVGVRAAESATRGRYEFFNYGKKIKGQYDCYPILEWTSAEVYLYVYANTLILNEAYKKGNSRAGCLFCPMTGGVNEYMRRVVYADKVSLYIDLVRSTSDKSFADSRFADFMNRGAWKTRGDGRNIAGTSNRYREEITNGKVRITVTNPLSDWKEWIKTLNCDVRYEVTDLKTGYTVDAPEADIKANPSMGKIWRQIFRKACYCSGCGVCASNCKHGRISFENGRVKITDCLHCLECHHLPGGCLLFDSLKVPKGNTTMRAINAFNDHAPKTSWISSFFRSGKAFFADNELGPEQQVKFKVFLADASLTVKNHLTPFAELVSQIGWKTETAQGLILVNLVAANPQIVWYIRNLEIGRLYSRQNVVDMLLADGLKDRSANSVAKSFKRIVETPLGTTLHFGYVTNDGELVRTKCSVSDPRVVLYGLFRFAEKCNDYKEFTLATLLNDSIDRDGISPSRIFGLDREDMIPLLLGLTAKYPQFILASFTHDLEKITLAEDKTSSDVLDLFGEKNTND